MRPIVGVAYGCHGNEVFDTIVFFMLYLFELMNIKVSFWCNQRMCLRNQVLPKGNYNFVPSVYTHAYQQYEILRVQNQSQSFAE